MCVLYHVALRFRKRSAFFAVYDGHAGPRAAKFCGENLHKYLAEKLPQTSIEEIEKGMKKTLVETYRNADEMFLKEASKK